MMCVFTKEELQTYSGKRVLVTGATGFIGGHLLLALQALEADVALITRDKTCLIKGAHVFVGSIRDKSYLEDALQAWQPAVIFHLAGSRERVLTHEAFIDSVDTNLIGTLNLIFSAVKLTPMPRVVVMGTAEEYGGNAAPFVEAMRELPVSAYSFSKQCVTHLSQLMSSSLGLPVTVIRPSVAYGPGQQSDMFLPALIQSLLQGKEFSMTLGEQTRDYVYVTDVVDALLKAGQHIELSGQVINVGSGESIKIKDLVNKVERMLEVSQKVLLGAVPYRVGESMDYCLDITQAKKLMGWKPQTLLDDGLKCTIAWYRKNLE